MAYEFACQREPVRFRNEESFKLMIVLASQLSDHCDSVTRIWNIPVGDTDSLAVAQAGPSSLHADMMLRPSAGRRPTLLPRWLHHDPIQYSRNQNYQLEYYCIITRYYITLHNTAEVRQHYKKWVLDGGRAAARCTRDSSVPAWEARPGPGPGGQTWTPPAGAGLSLSHWIIWTLSEPAVGKSTVFVSQTGRRRSIYPGQTPWGASQVSRYMRECAA